MKATYVAVGVPGLTFGGWRLAPGSGYIKK